MLFLTLGTKWKALIFYTITRCTRPPVLGAAWVHRLAISILIGSRNWFFCCRGGIHHAAFVAGAASAADSAAGAVAAAGTFACFPVTDHAADQHTRDQYNHSNKNNIDQIGRKPG